MKCLFKRSKNVLKSGNKMVPFYVHFSLTYSQILGCQVTLNYKELADKSAKYIALKKLVLGQERGKKRLELAHDLMDFALDTLEEMTQEPKKEIGMEENETEWEM